MIIDGIAPALTLPRRPGEGIGEDSLQNPLPRSPGEGRVGAARHA